MLECDIILGIDWLTKYCANLDYVSKSIDFLIPGELSFKFLCNPTSDAFLTSYLVIIKTTSAKSAIVFIHIVQDIEDVFQYFSILPLKRKIDFCIDLVMLPISWNKKNGGMHVW